VVPKQKVGCLKGGLIAVAAIFVVIIIIIVIAVVSGGGKKSSNSASSSNSAAGGSSNAVSVVGGTACKDAAPDAKIDTKRVDLYPTRPDSQPKNDHEAAVGDCVRVSGETAYLLSVNRTSVFGRDRLVITVKIENRDVKANSYGPFDWKIQTQSGQVLDASISIDDDALHSGDLVLGGTVTGTVTFDVPVGENYVIWKPGYFTDERGIWKVNA